MSVINNSIIAGAAGQSGGAAGYEIERSLRFNSADSAYLSRTPASAGNRKTWTWSGWVKRGKLGISAALFASRPTSSPLAIFYFSDQDYLRFDTNSSSFGSLQTNAVFRDCSAWYHVVLAVDSSQATDTNRLKLYVNGVQQTFASVTYPGQNNDGQINTATLHGIGAINPSTYTDYFDGYLADVHFIDGQALDPTSFGEFDATTGMWNPIAYTGSYGTNGFHLDFANNSSPTALGTDAAGSNDWTPNNFSVTAGADNDSLYDHPTNGDPADDTGLGGQVKGNYATLNPLDSTATLTNGNLDMASGSWVHGTGTIHITSGKWYFEAYLSSFTGAGALMGFTKQGNANVDAFRIIYEDDGSVNRDGTGIGNTTGLTTYGAGDLIGASIDMDADEIKFYKNGTLINTTTNAVIGSTAWRVIVKGDGAAWSVNFGQRPFAHQAPSGFRPLATPFLPTPAIADGSTAMDAVLYTGNNSTNTISGLGFSPDFVWTKARNNLGWNYLTDIIRGGTKPISSNSTAGEDTRNNHIQSWNSDGFTLGPDGTSNGLNVPGIAWCWDAGSSNTTYTAGSTPGAGTISCVLRANPSAGFSIVTWTGTGSAGSIAHGLGATPGFIACKDRGTNNWVCQHTSTGNQYTLLNLTEKAYTDAALWPSAAGSSTIAVGGGSNVNGLNRTYVAYCFAPIEGYSAMGSYTGNGSSTGDGAFVYCGFRPKWVLIKGSTTTDDDWKIYDSTRSINNVTDDFLTPNDPQVEITNNLNRLDFLSNGFKIRTEGTYALNVNNVPYIWVAFAENPFKYSRAR